MSDAVLLELKRTWEASGAVADEVAYLEHRVRVGELRTELLDLAAHCGSEAACRVLGRTPARPDYGDDWARAFARFATPRTQRVGGVILAAIYAACPDVTQPDVDAIEAAEFERLLPHRIQFANALNASRGDQLPDLPPEPEPDPLTLTVDYRLAHALLRLRAAEGPFIAAIRLSTLLERVVDRLEGRAVSALDLVAGACADYVRDVLHDVPAGVP